MNKSILIVTLILMLTSSYVFAQDSSISASQQNPQVTTKVQQNNSLGKVSEVLLVFLVLSIVFEVALTPVFNWRYFLAYFDGKGYKTPITVILAFIVFWRYDLDIIYDFLTALNYSATKSLGGQILTALLIAGGSDGIFRIFSKLGIRNPAAREEKAKEAKLYVERSRQDKE